MAEDSMHHDDYDRFNDRAPVMWDALDLYQSLAWDDRCKRWSTTVTILESCSQVTVDGTLPDVERRRLLP